MKALYGFLFILMLVLGGEGVMRICDIIERRHPGLGIWPSVALVLYLVLFGTFVYMSHERGSVK